MPQEYPLEITENAKRFGFKAANLMFLESLMKNFQRDHSSKSVIIPEIEAIENDQIIVHLKANILDFDQKWQKFCDLQSSNSSTIEPAAIQSLTELQTAIKDCFKNHIFEPVKLPNSAKFIVRSSGEEDRVDVANPGGNESVASLAENISESIGIVIASYVSEKSLSQRLKSGEDITSHFPLSPCLVQAMISGKNERNPSISGVIYTDNGHTRIQSAPGHGELIVNSKGNFDNYYITPAGKVYAEIRDKHIRLTSKMNESAGKMEQVEQDNDFIQATSPSLDEETATYLHDLANFIEQQYGMRMDIEFVYDNISKTANIVQARSIPEGDRRGMRPSALANQFISAHNPQNLKASVITPDINFASVISRLEEILICDTIEQALDTYLKSANQIKAVIVKRDAPDTSHEAGMFSSKAIPVLQMENLEEAKQWAANLTDNVLICDPQHKKLYQIPKSEYSEKLIQEGVYASTLSPYVTPFKREFKDEASISQLFATMQSSNPVQYDGKLLLDHLEILAIPKFGTDVAAQKEILANLLQFNGRIQKKGQISADLFKEIILTGNELSNLLESMGKEPYNEDRSKYYLNVFEKFNGLITAQRKKDVLSSSVIGEMHQAKTKAKYLEVAESKEDGKSEIPKSFFQILEEFLGDFEKSSSIKLTNTQKELFLEVAQLDKFIMTAKNQVKWREFCFDACKNN
jgi:hypothetical protein